MPGPLAGVKVVELGVWVAGPAAGLLLSDWGADVVKIEPPGIGDPGRLFARMLGGFSSHELAAFEDYLRRSIQALGGDSVTLEPPRPAPQRRQNAGVSSTRNV